MSRNFLIVGTQRTGSTALFRSLNFHPDIACGREWTHNVPWHKKLTVTKCALEGDFSVLTTKNRELITKEFHGGVRWLGFKLLFRSSDKWLFHPRFSPALWLDRLENYVYWLSQRPDIHIIHIVRRDQIEWLKSKYLSSKTGLFAVTPYPDGTKIEIPVRRAVKRLRAKNWVDARLATLAHTNSYVNVCYEDFLQSNKTVIQGLMEFLDCDPAQLGEIDYRGQNKQSRGSAADYISNYDQLIAELQLRNLNEYDCNLAQQ